MGVQKHNSSKFVRNFRQNDKFKPLVETKFKHKVYNAGNRHGLIEAILKMHLTRATDPSNRSMPRE
ncbi:MAG: hypothetical protein COA42_02530 [Alteromonadaceae bacterium]|nr:MAG: hypothetical protein COA42_02530 [Alteromonadaceae bacterium]